MKHTNKTALITGASRGLGLALAQTLAEKGWNLILVARTEQPLIDAKQSLHPNVQTKVIAVVGSINDEAVRQTIKKVATEQTGPLDLIINNASTLGPSPRPELLSLTSKDWRDIIETNVISPLALIQTLRQQLHARPTILNISSDAGREAYEGWGAYGSSKAMLDHWSRTLGAEQEMWRVLSVDPGDMNTQMHQEAFPGEDISDRHSPASRVPGLLHLIEGDHPSGLYAAGDFI